MARQDIIPYGAYIVLRGAPFKEDAEKKLTGPPNPVVSLAILVLPDGFIVDDEHFATTDDQPGVRFLDIKKLAGRRHCVVDNPAAVGSPS